MANHIKKYWYLYLLCLISFFIVFCGAFSEDVNNFGKFSSSVWGTVADWLTYIVTLAGAIFVGITLRDQVEINKQNLEEARRAIRPYFKTQIISPEFKGDKGKIKIYLTNAIAINVRSANVSEEARAFFLDHYFDIWELDHIGVYIDLNKVPEFKNTLHLFDFHFEDEIGRTYQQSFDFGNNQIMSNFPILRPD